MILNIFTLFIFATLIWATSAHNILIFIGLGSYSLKLTIWPLATELANRGHNVTVISGFDQRPFPHSNITDLYASSVSAGISSSFGKIHLDNRMTGNVYAGFEMYKPLPARMFERSINAKEDINMQRVISDESFDLVITTMFYGEVGLAIAHRCKAKTIMMARFNFLAHLHDILGIPNEPAMIPDLSITSKIWYTNDWRNRIRNYFSTMYWYAHRRFFVNPVLEETMRKTLVLGDQEVPPFEDLYRNTDLIFLSTHHSFDYGQSLPPFVIPVGGMACYLPQQPLTSDMKSVLDSATSGVVLVSLGSTLNLNILPPEILAQFFAMLTHFPEITFIWKWDGPTPEVKFKNLVLSSWVPQFDILGHPNVKAFITHGGLNSINEATFHSVPVLVIPIFADQDYNAYRTEVLETGVRLELRTLSEDILIKSVKSVLEDTKYLRNMKIMSEQFKDRPMNPVETAAYWTEYLLRQPANSSSLKPLQNVAFYQRRLWDVYICLVGPFYLLIYVVSKKMFFNR